MNTEVKEQAKQPIESVYIDQMQICLEQGGYEAIISSKSGKVATIYAPTIEKLEDQAINFCKGYNAAVSAATPPKEAEGESLEDWRKEIAEIAENHMYRINDNGATSWSQMLAIVDSAAYAARKPLLARIKELQEELSLRPQQQTK